MAPKKIGILVGFEDSFPHAFIKRVNELDGTDIVAEFVRVGAPRMGEPSGYDLIVDRISHEIMTYKPFLKNAVLTGTYVVNDPFWWLADDKFFDGALVSQLGVAHPKTAIIPAKKRFPRTTEMSYRNQALVDWKEVFDYIGFPAILKPYDGGGWRNVYKVNNPQEFFRAYEETGTLVMILQECIDFDDYFRCLSIGKDNILPIRYNPRAYFHERYVAGPVNYDDPLVARVVRDARTICHALGYDMNSVEFACKDGIPYAIDFMNPAPDMDYHSIRPENFDWVVNAMADMCIRYVKESRKMSLHHNWQAMLAKQQPAQVVLQ
jgi:glutathione synthase/RimK-type ligase-like ATP-grasp enzyme